MSNYKDLLKSKQDVLLQIKNDQRKQRNIEYQNLNKSMIEIINKDISTIKQNKKNRDELLKDYLFNEDENYLIDCFINNEKSISISNIDNEKFYDYLDPQEYSIRIPLRYINTLINKLQELKNELEEENNGKNNNNR